MKKLNPYDISTPEYTNIKKLKIYTKFLYYRIINNFRNWYYGKKEFIESKALNNVKPNFDLNNIIFRISQNYNKLKTDPKFFKRVILVFLEGKIASKFESEYNNYEKLVETKLKKINPILRYFFKIKTKTNMVSNYKKNLNIIYNPYIYEYSRIKFIVLGNQFENIVDNNKEILEISIVLTDKVNDDYVETIEI